MKYLTFDTSWLERMGYNFSFAAFKCIQYTDYQAIISSIIDQEIKKHITEKSKLFVSSYNNAFKNARFLSNIKKIPEPLKTEDVINAALSSYDLFKKEIRAVIVPAKQCNIDSIVKDYFGATGVFSESQKKYEFPDAIAVDSISNYVGNNKIIVFSSDNDWKNYFNGNINATVYCETSDLLKIVKTDDLATEVINDYLDGIIDEFSDHINNNFEKYFLNIHILFPEDFCVEDLDIDDFDFEFLKFESIEIISKDKNQLSAAIYFKYNFNLSISFSDFSECIYDKEDSRRYNIIRRHRTISGSEVGYCLVDFTFHDDKFAKITLHKLLDVDFCYNEDHKYKIDDESVEENDYYDSSY